MNKSASKAVEAYVALVKVADHKFNEVGSGLLLAGVTATQFSVLKMLKLHGPQTQREIAGRILKSEGNLTYVMDRLESMGYVVRERGTLDRRQNMVSLTKQGLSFFEGEYPNHLERIEKAMEGLDTSEVSQLLGLLQKLDEKLESAC